MSSHNLVTNLQIKSAATSPAYTVGSGISTFAYDVQILCPLDPAATLSFVLERSSDGVNYTVFNSEELTGGAISKGPNAGSQATQDVSGEIDNVNQGDKIRARVVAVNGGSGTWMLTGVSIITE